MRISSQTNLSGRVSHWAVVSPFLSYFGVNGGCHRDRLVAKKKPESVQEVNEAFANAGFKKERLVICRVGCRAFYFENIGDRNAPSEPIEVSHVSDYTIDQWIEALRRAEVEEKLSSRPDWEGPPSIERGFVHFTVHLSVTDDGKKSSIAQHITASKLLKNNESG